MRGVLRCCVSETMEPTVGPESPGMASSRKRLHQEFEDVSAVDQEAKCATIHAVVTSLSPMKASRSRVAFVRQS